MLHVVWATGSTWPADDRDKLADLVLGHRPLPSTFLTWLVAALLAAATAVTGRATLGDSPSRAVRLGARAVGATLLVRGAGGLIVSGADLEGATPEYRRLDLRLYSPLCLALGAATTVSVRSVRR